MSVLRRITERYRLDKLVAASETSSVFRGIDTQSGETVAIKLLNSDGAESAEQHERFLELCRGLQSIHQANLPRVLDFGFTTAGSAFLVSEYISGESLTELSGLSPTRALGLLLGVVDGLEALAQAGLACRNLKAANLLVATVAGSEQVKILGLGSPALRPEAPPPADEAWRQDFFDFGGLVYRLLGLSTGIYSEVAVPQEVAARLADSEALGTLVQAALQKDPKGRFPSCADVRRALHQALFGRIEVAVTPRATVFVPGLGAAGAVTVAVRPERAFPAAAETVAVVPSGLPEPGENPQPEPSRQIGATLLPFPSSPAAPPAPSLPPRPELPTLPPIPVAPTEPPGKGRLLIAVGAAAGIVLLAGLLFLGFRRGPERFPPPVPKAVSTPPPPRVPAQPAPRVNPQIGRAEAALAKGDLEAVKAALDSISARDREVLGPDERDRYQRLRDSLAPLKRAELAARLARALETGDPSALRRAVNAIPAADEAALPATGRKDLERARRGLEAEAGLSRADKEGDHLAVIREAAALLQELPGAAHAGELRDQAARAVEAEVDAAIDAGQYDEAASRLEWLRQAWPERAGLAARTGHIAAERQSDQDMESILAAVDRSGKANKPLEGLQLLADVKPGRRYADRVQDLRQRLNAQFAQADRQAPVLVLRGSPEAEYEKGKTATVPLRITDDFAVKAAEGWARAEGGQYTKVAVRHLSGEDYTLDVPPDLHQNKTIELYVTAADLSGHTGQLGSAERPLKMKRKGFLKSIFGGKDEG
ncbi:MAG TPA: protein kinase [Thermoanaerobaculia bacterium]|jgi:hypothetical protein|nr:protein kinase [Thermoanaerobaculia bacterium]